MVVVKITEEAAGGRGSAEAQTNAHDSAHDNAGAPRSAVTTVNVEDAEEAEQAGNGRRLRRAGHQRDGGSVAYRLVPKLTLT